RAHQLDLAVWQQTLAANLTGVFLCCKYAIPLMLPGGGGSIINCGSPTGLTGCGAGYDAYSASKGGVMALTRAMAMAYAHTKLGGLQKGGDGAVDHWQGIR